MTEPESKISHHILSLLEGETIRVILHDGTVMEGKLGPVGDEGLRLEDTSIPINKIATYFLLKEY